MGRVGRPHHLDLRRAPRAEVERRHAAYRQGRRLHLQPHPQGRVREDQLRLVRGQHDQGGGHRRHHRGVHGRQAHPGDGPHVRVHPARAHLVEDRQEGRHQLQERGHPRFAHGGLGPLHDDRAQGGPVHPHAGQPQLARRPAAGRRDRVQGLRQCRRHGPGAQEGRDRLRRGPRDQRVELAAGRRGNHHRGGPAGQLQRVGLQHRCRARRRQADR